MFEGNLADFDELVLSVRDRNSREYVGEAVVNYQSRCYRSAISAAWVAVTYDIISKIRKLSNRATLRREPSSPASIGQLPCG